MTFVLLYPLAACLMLAAGVVLLIRRGQSEAARHAAVAAVVSAAWAALMAFQARHEAVAGWGVFAADGLRIAAWFVALESLTTREFPRWLRRTVFAAGIAMVASAVIGWASGYQPAAIYPGLLAAVGFVAALGTLVAALHVWRHASPAAVRAIRWCAAAAAAQFAFDALNYLPLTAREVGAGGPDWVAPRIAFCVLSVWPLMRAVWLMPVPPPRVFISRQFAFYASTLIVLCLYVGVTVGGAYYARTHAGEWGAPLQALFLGTAVALLIGFLLAEWPLRRLRVFIATHFYRNKYDYRLEWLRFVQTLSIGEETDARRNAIRAVAQIFDSPRGLLLLRDDAGRQFYLQAAWPEDRVAFPECTPVAVNDPLPRFLQARQWVVDLHEYAAQPQLYGDLALPAWLGQGCPWRLIAPLFVGDQLLGMLVLAAPPQPFDTNYEDRDLLKTVGRNVAVQLAQRRADEQLAESRQFDAYNRFAAFVMHDLKNSVAQLQLLVANAQRHRHNPVFFDDAVGTIRNTSERMTRLIEQLQRRETQGTRRAVDLEAAVQAAVARAVARQPAVSVNGDLAGVQVSADPDRLAAVLEHVIRNAQEATPPTGAVSVELQMRGDEAHLTVVDNGAGMDEDFLRHRLFRPFDSTKGAKGMGIGAYQAREYARDLGGDVEVCSAPGRGTRFCIRLPAWRKTN
ncbi:MAG TPA: XrtA/PEP-CTERM system histidine kinase PrsK [Steroidobacteraceae bacterium]|nr:XrtA/PEP-CTERM system histidine kinase PrsK [Steroidobacteraceae bacterium]